MEEKLELLAYKIVNYSLRVKENERVLIKSQINNEFFIKKIIKYIIENKGIPFFQLINQNIETHLLEITDDNRIEQLLKKTEYEVENYDSFINILYNINDYLNESIDPEINKKISLKLKDINNVKINERKWVMLNYPSPLDANKAKINTDKYRILCLNAMNVDYSKIKKDLEPLKKLMEETDKVKIIGPNTDIEFSIKGIPVVICAGENNLPDGEVFTAPVRDSVNGIITYNVKSPQGGEVYDNISLKFKKGKIIEAKCDGNNKKLEDIFETDEGARYIGEFSLGINPLITEPIGDILYDEKIIGSIHFTPGQAYDDAYNGNDSVIHWDLVLIQRKEYGGGEIYFDDKLVRKDGLFILPELIHLNYNLK